MKKDFQTGALEEFYPIGTFFWEVTLQVEASGYHHYVALYSGGDFQTFITNPSSIDSEFVLGDQMLVKWFAPQGVAKSDSVYVDLSRDAGASWQNLIGPVPYNFGPGLFSGEFNWTVTGPVSSDCFARVRAFDMAGNSDTVMNSGFAIGCAPVANFITDTSAGVIPFAVTFTDISSFALMS